MGRNCGTSCVGRDEMPGGVTPEVGDTEAVRALWVWGLWIEETSGRRADNQIKGQQHLGKIGLTRIMHECVCLCGNVGACA